MPRIFPLYRRHYTGGSKPLQLTIYIHLSHYLSSYIRLHEEYITFQARILNSRLPA